MKMSITSDPRENHILATVSENEYELLAPHLELVHLSCSEILFDAKDKLQYIYFPTTAITSLLCCLEEGTSVEVAMVGSEGILGVFALMGDRNEALTQALINVSGYGYRIPIKSIRQALTRSGGRRSGMLQKLILRYTQTLFIQISQTTACNRRHTLEQQLCRWLLLNFDRGQSHSLFITQESIAYILGVRRESITEAAKKLQQAGIIQYSRGYIELIDRTKLEHATCECYDVMKGESLRLRTDLHAA